MKRLILRKIKNKNYLIIQDKHKFICVLGIVQGSQLILNNEKFYFFVKCGVTFSDRVKSILQKIFTTNAVEHFNN